MTILIKTKPQFTFERRMRQTIRSDLIFLPPLIPYAYNPSLDMLSYTVPHPLTYDIVFLPAQGKPNFTVLRKDKTSSPNPLLIN